MKKTFQAIEVANSTTLIERAMNLVGTLWNATTSSGARKQSLGSGTSRSVDQSSDVEGETIDLTNQSDYVWTEKVQSKENVVVKLLRRLVAEKTNVQAAGSLKIPAATSL